MEEVSRNVVQFIDAEYFVVGEDWDVDGYTLVRNPFDQEMNLGFFDRYWALDLTQDAEPVTVEYARENEGFYLVIYGKKPVIVKGWELRSEYLDLKDARIYQLKLEEGINNARDNY